MSFSSPSKNYLKGHFNQLCQISPQVNQTSGLEPKMITKNCQNASSQKSQPSHSKISSINSESSGILLFSHIGEDISKRTEENLLKSEEEFQGKFKQELSISTFDDSPAESPVIRTKITFHMNKNSFVDGQIAYKTIERVVETNKKVSNSKKSHRTSSRWNRTQNSKKSKNSKFSKKSEICSESEDEKFKLDEFDKSNLSPNLEIKLRMSLGKMSEEANNKGKGRRRFLSTRYSR